MGKTIIFTIFIGVVLLLVEFIGKKQERAMEFMDFTYTNVLKGSAAIMIVISHVSGLTGTRVATPLGGIGVAIFLICSGYGMQKSYDKKNLKEFWVSKLKRIMVPYWIAVILYYILNYDNHILSVREAVLKILLIKPVPYLWFVQYLMLMNLIFYFLYRFFTQKNRIIVGIGLCAAALLLIQNDLYAEQSFSFILGICLASTESFPSTADMNKYIKIGIICVLTGLLFLGVKQIPVIRNSNYIIINIVQLMIKLPIASGIVLILWKIVRKWNFALKKCGQCSYELYIIHTLFIIYLMDNKVSIPAMGLYLLYCIGATVLLHIFLNKLNKRMPSI